MAGEIGRDEKSSARGGVLLFCNRLRVVAIRFEYYYFEIALKDLRNETKAVKPKCARIAKLKMLINRKPVPMNKIALKYPYPVRCSVFVFKSH